MPVLFAFVLEHDARPGFGRKSSRVAKALLEIVGEHWHEHMLPKHFEEGAPQRYGYQKRTAGHIKRRAQRWGWGTEPAALARSARYALAFKGDMRADLKRNYSVRAFPSRFSVVMPSKGYVGMRPMGTNMPNLGEEATIVLPEEERELAALAEARLPDLIEAEGGKVRVTIR